VSAVARRSTATFNQLAALTAARPQLSVETIALASSLFFTVFCNGAFWHRVAGTGALQGTGGWLTAISLFCAITALHMLLLCVVLYRRTAKGVLALLFMVTAMAAHYMDQYTVYFDADMIRNILHTDGKESGEMISLGLVWPLLLHGLLPTVLVWRVRLKARPLKRALLVRALCLVAAVVVAGGAMLLSFQNLSTLMRNHTEIRHLITPGNYLVSLGRAWHDAHKAKDQPRMPVGTEAKVVGRAATAKPRLVVVVLGETVRAQNWGLNGYARQTTPELQRIGPINFPDVTACGSSTEVSVPCMFSPYGRAHYDKARIEQSESLLHVLEHAGIATLWRDNQTGCKGVCDGLAFESFEHARHPALCNAEGCLDEVMLDGLADEVNRRPGDRVIVLHQLGNHGPSYFLRYPQRLQRFMPACHSSDLGDCSRTEIVNAYDNAVLHTDEFLARTIRFLAEQSSTHDTAMIYVSDHGESLGEKGLYLHGVPYAIAPETQTKVPMVMWLSPGLVTEQRIDMPCMRRHASSPASQDNLFHSLLGLMQVRTGEYDERLDLFHGCTHAG
jgi:lipid A ethanolaminephosphotransferase